jgi:alkanesulfonate monooxygenase SsuD/methylene tetrahydromethanopterin reductase-like flavin-dependent oxidoreductase (luciferase family)
MMRLAGQVCDGVRLHPFATQKYIAEIALPEIESGLAKSGRDRSSFEIWGGGFVATGADQETLAQAREDIRARIAFYGSTRTYLPVLALHGWEDLGSTLHQMSRQGFWSKMAAEVPDHVVDEFSIVAPPDELIPRVRERFQGLTDTIAVDFSALTDENAVRQLVVQVQDIDSQFKQFSKTW